MTKEQYLMMCEQTGEEIDWDRCPPEPEDFPSSVITALNIFNSLGNKVYGDVEENNQRLKEAHAKIKKK